MSLRFERGKPNVCLSLTERTIAENLAILERERRRIDLAELRVDFLDDRELGALPSFPRLAAGLPVILVYRRTADGGRRRIDERDRIKLLDRALDGAWSYVDFEEDLAAPALETKAVERGATVIRSMHDFSGVPNALSARLRNLPRGRGEVPKIAVMPHSVEELLSLLDCADVSEPAASIVVGMGEWGFPTRVLPSRFGSVLSYCTAGSVKAAPGHVDPETLRTVYRVGEVTGDARIYCVIGNPVMHSRSPWIHNPAYRALGLDAVYVPIQVDRLSHFMELAERLHIAGASVTVPHKEEVAGLLATSDRSVADAGACNTLVRERAGWHGYNTDIAGFLSPLRARLGDRLAGARALLVGAGGAARAVAAALVSAGCSLTIVNRSEPRARSLASRFGCGWATLADVAGDSAFDIVVQATSVGMSPNEAGDPLPGLRFRGGEVVYELIYAPRRTLFLERAERAGCRVIGGREMLLHQAYAQFELFTGSPYPQGIEPADF